MSPEEYLAQSRSQQDTATKQVAFSLTQDKNTDPDQYAADIKLGQSLSVPTSLASQYRDTFAQKLEQKRNETILSTSPKLANWIKEPDNAKVAKDDVQALSWWEQFSKGALSGQVIESGKGLAQAPGYVAGTSLEGSGQLLTPVDPKWRQPIIERIANAAGLDEAGQHQLRADIFAQGDIPPQAAQSALAGILAGDYTSDDVRAQFGVEGDPIWNGLKISSEQLQAWGEWLQDYSSKTLPPVKGMENSVGRTLGFGLGTAGTLALVGWLGGPGPLAVVAGTGGAGQTAADARRAGQSEEMQTRAALWGIGPGLTDMIPLERVFLNPATRKGILGVLRSVGTQFALEGGQEGVQQTLQNAVAKYLYDPDKSLVADVPENIMVGGAVGALMDVGRLLFEAALPGRIRHMPARAQHAAEAKQVIDQIGEAATSSKLNQRLPSSFIDFVGKATEGTPIQDIYVPVDKMQEMFQSYRFEPSDFFADLPGVDPNEWQDAINTGRDVKIPTATYAGKLAGTEFDQFLRQNMRFEPDGMTLAEAEEFNQHADEIRQQAYEDSEASRINEDAARAVDEQEYDELVGRLRAAGQSTDVALFNALPIVSMRRTMAQLAGITPEEFSARNPLPEIRGAVPEGLQAKNVDELTRQLAAMRAYKAQPVDSGPSLLEAISDYGGINDTGGELKARDAAVIKRGRGKKNLRLVRGGVVSGVKDMFGGGDGKKHGLDDVAQAMIDAGYLQDNAVANEYRHAVETGGQVPNIGKALLDAIDEELRGKVQYSGAQQVDEKATAHDANVAYLDSLGVSLDDSDDVIRGAIQKAQAEEGQKYSQPTLRQKLVKLREALGDLLTFAKEGKRGESSSVDIATISDAVADIVEIETGVDIHGFTHVLDSSAVRHMLKNHGDVNSETQRGMVPITDEDILNIPDMLASADYVVTGGKGRRGNDLIGYLKKLDDGTTLYIEEARIGRQKLGAVTMRKYPATSDYLSIAKTISPNVRNDGGNGVTITEIPAGSKTLFQGSKDNRGSIQIPFGGASSSPVIISLFESADLSTTIHETGHYFLYTLQDMQTASPAIKEMYDGVRGWWHENAEAVAVDAKDASGLEVSAADVRAALDNGTTGDGALDAAIDTGMHEQFARGYEAYVMEGKAPSIELRPAFERFTQWLLRLYKHIRGLNVRISPEMRNVYDRLLATDQEITAAREDVSDHMLFAAAEAAGVSEADYRKLVRMHEQSVDAANQKLRKEVMAPIQRETEKWFKEEKARVRDEVTDQINRRPEYRVWEWLGNRRWFGESQPEGMPDMRMDRKTLVDRYGEGVLKTLPRGQFTLYTNEGGMNPDEVAGWFGFESGDRLVQALEQAPTRREAINDETDRVMRELHGDVMRDGQIEERAIEAVHNDARGQFLAAELKVLKARVGDTSPSMTASQAREAARQTLNGMQVRDATASNRFLTAERKAANEAIKLARLVERENLWSRQQRRDVQSAVESGSLRATNTATDKANASTHRYNDAVAKLVEQKRRQLLNHMLYSESQKIAEEVEVAERYVSRLGKKSSRTNLAGDYLEAIDELLERYDFRKLSIRSEQRRGSLLAYVNRMILEGRANELSIPEEVLQEAQRKPYRQLPVEQLRGIIDTLKNIEHTARLKQKLKDAKRERDLDAVVGDVISEFEANVKGKEPSRARSGRSDARRDVRGYLNLVKNADTILREIDGFKDNGAAYRHIKGPIDDAVNDLTIKRREAGERFEQLYSVYTKQERRSMTTLQSIPELNGQFSKWDLISIALNTGNEGNYQRLTDPRVKGHFTPQQIDVALGRLDERDWKFVQSTWDMIGEYWPDIAAREKRISGVAPERVEPREVTTNYGTMKGGYYPLKYDAEISSLARDDDLRELAANMTGGRYGKAQTRNGHTKERASSSGRPVLVDIGVLHGHINQVIHDLALSEVVTNSWRILQNNEVKSAFLERGLKSDFDSLEVWLQDVASGEVRSADFMNRWSRKLKSGFTVSKLAFNLTTVLLQPTGLAQSVVVVGKKNFLLGVQDMFRRPLMGPNSAASEIIDKSPFMQERETTFNKDIYDILGETKSGPTQNRVSQFTSDYLAPWGFWLMQKAQFYAVDMPTWLAGYRQAINNGMSEKDAISHADRIVARAAASGNFSDRTPIERGTLSGDVRQNDVVRLFTTLGSYMFAKFNVAYEKTRQTQFNDPRQVLSWTADMVMLFTVEAVLAAAVRGNLPWGDDDEEEDGWAEFLGKQTAMSIASTLPFVRDIASGVQGFSGGGAYGSMMDTIARPIYQASQGEVDKAFVRALVDAGGLFLHAPSAQINRFIDASWRQSEGDDVSPMEYIMGKSK
jgi:hypothetical protein